ncbi:hypothetical protein JOD57_002855 [Geodermatophilus bullaregiensis]|uniref:glycoside hydrolase family 26 protein n=1 Tax=Geodermatophilus bullaregiensis TaxID=1564160 RepID=UPI00195A43B9|nr:glycosyl hydrolase [Geodermatophilus bullaregiensis]MBM7807018.1 hypothetical protein [Geodermatophilus bullaregiensis]
MSSGLDRDDVTEGSPSVLEGPPTPAPTARGRRRTRWVVAGVAAVAAVGVTGAVVLNGQTSEPVPVALDPDPVASPPANWLSGASGHGVASGEYGTWRGRPMEIAGTWVDNDDAMVALYQLQPGAEYGAWDGPLDVAIGAFDEGGSWEEAADGDYDRRWRESLTNLRDLRADRPGTVYIRLAHEMNGTWVPWAVNADNHQAFVEAWQRFRDLQQEVYPEAQLVFCVNRESVGTDMDWREFFPGAEYVDVMAVDYYNNYPYVDTAEEWQESLLESDDWGAPKGLQRHLEFARSVGLPLAVPEWSGNADEGDSPAFIRGMYEFFSEHGGTGAGDVLYEIHFNVHGDGDRWTLFGEYTRMPESTELYQQLW